ncbi:hypothetical protein BGX31_010687 [Mortierella sp. GBA43]|nr:hypothetical protein BGX31_010687 [Mortierella sp. GBA43]
MDIYFRSVHPTLPMLHQTAIYEQLQRQEPSPSHLLFAILGLASRFSDDPVFHTPQLGASQPPIDMFFDQARSLIKEVYDYSQMETVQALLLLSIQQMGVCENHRAWLYVGMAIRMALDLGLNRELPEQDRSRDRGRAELRRRTWWSCYVVERLVCAGLGRPLTITLQECQTAFPRDDYSLGELTETTISNRQPTLISDFVHLIALLRIQGDILEFINARSTLCDTSNNGFNSDHPQRVDTSQAAFSRLDQSLFDWRHGLPSTLQTPTSQSPQFGLFLHMTYNTLIILLHRPEMTHSADSASVCIQAAATITDITKLLVEAKALTSMFVSCLQAIFSAGVIHFLNIPSADSPSDLSNPSPDGPSALDESTNPLLSAKTGLKQCTDALKILSTHWVCAAQRAKVLEDLVDQRQIALKDVETLSKTTPMMSPWVLDRIEHTKVVDISSESQDRLHHQQRRSKVMTIQSLLATEDEHHSTYHHQTRCLSMEYSTLNPNVFDVNGQDKVMFNASSEGTDMNDDAMDTWNETLDLPVDQPPSNTASEVDNVFSTNSLQCHQPQQGQLVKDPKLDSIATFGLEGGAESAATKVPFMLTESSMTNGSKTFSMPSLMTPSGSGAAVSTEPQPTQQGVMLDPFSIPSSITFPSQMQRALARAEPLFSTTCLEDPAKQMQDGPSQNIALLQPEMSSSVPRQVGYHTMAWNDMPPTLGLDEWTAYIGVLRARRQANDEPSSRSDMTP